MAARFHQKKTVHCPGLGAPQKKKKIPKNRWEGAQTEAEAGTSANGPSTEVRDRSTVAALWTALMLLSGTGEQVDVNKQIPFRSGSLGFPRP